MSDQVFQPVETPLGILYGRDAICLDRLDVDINQDTLTLQGDFNGRLASKPVDGQVAYSLVFAGVLAFKVIELDSWDFNSASSFDKVVNSEWRDDLGGKVDQSYKHYLIQTYDLVIDVVCRRFKLTIDS